MDSNAEILKNLEIAKVNLESTLKYSTNYFNITYQNAYYTTYNFKCPEGYEFDGSNFICGMCMYKTL